MEQNTDINCYKWISVVFIYLSGRRNVLSLELLNTLVSIVLLWKICFVTMFFNKDLPSISEKNILFKYRPM